MLDDRKVRADLQRYVQRAGVELQVDELATSIIGLPAS